MEEGKWLYDPHHITSRGMMEEGLGPYLHHPNLQLKILENKESWAQVLEIMKEYP